MPYNTTADVQDLPLNQATPEAMRVKKVVVQPEDLDFPSISLNFDNDNENDSSEEITPIKVSSPSRRREGEETLMGVISSLLSCSCL